MSGEGGNDARGAVERSTRHVQRHFDIRKQIMLGFFNGQEQYDVLVDPGQGKLMFDGCDIYWLFDNQRRMSDTINNAIEIWLSDGSIEEVLPIGSATSDGPAGGNHEK
ncbi:hypothetical protein [Pelomonas sp. Root1217]|uniref:hypothetical protein n=1 Tax=Pelomonas sp. Root1217 TaxID=1736430 RepID=UPI00070C422D|nr:hypothetical protein [Pelomonas sp. Root1217]